MALTLSFAFLIAALVCLFGPSSAFQRTVPNISPFDTPYTSLAGIFNTSGYQILPVGTVGVNSFGTAWFITDLETQQNWFFSSCVIAATSPNGDLQQSYFFTILNLADPSGFASTANIDHAEVSSTSFDWKFPDVHSYSSAPDDVSSITFISTLPDYELNLTSTSAGPNFYHAASGTFFWGTDLTHEWSAPESLVEGTWSYKGRTFSADSSKSLAWFDRQWGPGYPAAGHHYFSGILSNGLKLAIWSVNAVGANPVQAFVTVMNTDGSHEVHPIDPDIHASEPFTAEVTGNSYDSKYVIEIPGIATLKIVIPVLLGEAVNATNPDLSAVFFEAYTTVDGTWKGETVTGYGSTEIHSGDGI